MDTGHSQGDSLKPSPGLNMDHGFLKKIEQNQLLRERQARDDVNKRMESAKLAKKVGFQLRSTKPAMQIYRPPSLRASGDFTPLNGSRGGPGSGEGSDDSPIPWMTETVPNVHQPIALSKSKSTTSAHKVHFQLPPHQQLTASTSGSRGYSFPEDQEAAASAMTSFAHDGQQSQRVSKKESFGLKRSKSLGSGDMKLYQESQDVLDTSGFSLEIQSAIGRAMEDPNKLTARQLMEIVRHLFTKVLESVRYAEPTARLCIAIILKEKNETFLESLLNSCREWYNERDRLFNSAGGPGGSHQLPSMKPTRWVAYVTFLYELYTRLKSTKQTPMVSTNTPPSAIILTLLSECCLLFLKPSSLKGHSEIECLFIVLTSIGRDLKNEYPQRMQALMSAVREAFLVPSIPQTVRKTLLQLIELSASNWQLMAPAVTYYYPGSRMQHYVEN